MQTVIKALSHLINVHSLHVGYVLEMCGNGFQHSHSLPFPSIQFPFPPIPIPNFLTYSHSRGIPVWATPIPILSMLKLYIISDTVIIIICS